MASEEEKQILRMVEAGKISADEAMKLIKAIEEDSAEAEIQIIEPEAGLGGEGSPIPEFEEVKARAQRFAMVPLGIGVVFTVLASYWLFALVQSANYGFWFVCAWFPLLLGVLMVALSAGGMNARWLYVNVDQRPGERPQHITLGFPIPMGLLDWALRTFGSFIPGMDRQRVDEILTLLATADAHGPLVVNVDESGHGERVQVYFG
jgi:hypothetical protein